MGQVVAIDPDTLCEQCDDPILNDPAPVTANVQMHEETEMRARTWHGACVPADIALVLELESSYKEDIDG